MSNIKARADTITNPGNENAGCEGKGGGGEAKLRGCSNSVVSIGDRSNSMGAIISGGNNTTKNHDQNQPICSKGTLIMRSLSMFLTSGKLNSQKGIGNTSTISKKIEKRKRMDSTKGKLYSKTLEMLKKKTKFTKRELETLCQTYKKLVSNCQLNTRTLTAGKPNTMIEGIDRIVFRELLYSTFDIVTEEILMERMFCVWDKDHEGAPIKLEGWLIGLSIFLKGTLTEKTTFCFRIYDLNADGFITKDEMFTLLRNCLIKQPQDDDPDEGVKDLVEIILKKFDLDKDGKVSFEDYFQTVKSEPLLLEAFGQCLPSENAVASFFYTLNN